MKKHNAILLSLIGILKGSAALAGGSAEPVKVISFAANGDTDYTLVVAPVAPSEPGSFRDPYVGHCERFTVMGTYSRLAGLYLTQPPMVTRAAHLDALKYLSKAAASNATIQLGWMGEGFFVSNPGEPCAVKSRALVLFADEHGTTVVSFYHAL